MEIDHYIENEIVAKLSDVVYVEPTYGPIFLRYMICDGRLDSQQGWANRYSFSYNINDESLVDLKDFSKIDDRKLQIEYDKRHNGDRGVYDPYTEYVCYNVAKRTTYDPARVYITKIHECIYGSAELIEKEYDIRHFSNAVLGNLDRIMDDVRESKFYNVGNPFIICSRNFVRQIEKYESDYVVDKSKYADVYDRRCEFIRKYGNIIADEKVIGLYVDELMEDDEEIILGLQSRECSIGVKLYYYMLCEPARYGGTYCLMPWSYEGKVGYINSYAVMSSPYDDKIYKRIRFAEHTKSKEEIEKEDFNNRVKYFNS